MSEHVPETDLREFLRTRRARITPEQAGIPRQPGVRRVPGLRREEVARLAGVSLDYYIRLERGRGASVSASVLEAVARVLQLDDIERQHLFALAKPSRQRRGAVPLQRARPGLMQALQNITDIPALLLGRRFDVLAANHLARALYLGFAALPAGQEPNLARFVFLNDAARDLYVDWSAAARETVGVLRLHASHHPHDPRLAQLVGDLSVRDADFRRWWADHNVYQPQHGTKRYNHPLVGELTLGFEALAPTDAADQTLALHPVEVGSPSEKALRLLASCATDNSHIDSEQSTRREG